MKLKERISIQFINEWKQFIPSDIKWNWITFTFFDFEIERDIRFNQFSIIIIILGLGIRITICGESEELEMLIEDYKKSSLNNKNNKK